MFIRTQPLGFFLLLVSSGLLAILSVVYPDSREVRLMSKSDFRKLDNALVWDFDRQTSSLERLTGSDALGSVVFLGERLIPLRTSNSNWAKPVTPWHEVTNRQLRLIVDDKLLSE